MPQQHTETVHSLAGLIERAGLRVPVRMMLDALEPLDFLSSQVAVFAQPFTAGSSWERYTTALTDAQSWDILRQVMRADASGEVGNSSGGKQSPDR